MVDSAGHNSVFSNTSADDNWIEIYHSRPSWKVCQISFKKNSDEWVPFGKYRLIDASAMKAGFRVFRIRANQFEFRLADGRNTCIDSNSGRNYVIKAPGRYVVESGEGCKWVSDAQIADCLRAFRPNDEWIEIVYESSRQWRSCFIHYAIDDDDDNSEWFKVPMDGSTETGKWSYRVAAKTGITCVFYDGDQDWDNNQLQNYHMPIPGKYFVKDGCCRYCGVSSLDLHIQTKS